MAKTSNPQTSMSKTDNNEKNKKQKKKKKSKSGPNAMPMKLKAPPANPFESIWSRRKFDTLGKKSKGEERRMGHVRSIAIEKRKKTLLKEYQQSGKASVFIDKRIGEDDETLEEFDKALLRSQRQMKSIKKSKYNLSDGEEDEDSGFPSLGALTGRDSFDDEVLANDNECLADDDDDDKASADMSKKDLPLANDRGVMEGEEKRHKSKKEVMAEIIAKSKFFKAEKAKAKEENERFVEELDQKFASIQSDAWASFTNPANVNALKTLVSRSIPTNDQIKKDDFASHGDKSKEVDQDKPDFYDKLLKEMALEMRARPSDRIKTPEEVVQEERERLEHLEEERQKRMHADDEFTDEENEEADKSFALKPRPISGDDLGDSFTVVEEPSRKKGWVDRILGRNDDEDDDSSANSDYDDDHVADERTGEDAGDGESNEGEMDDDGDEGSEEEHEKHKIALKDWEQSDDDIIETNLEADEEDSKEKELRANRVGKGKECNDVASISQTYISNAEGKKFDGNAKRPRRFEIPYIIEAPKSLEEFSSLLNNCSGSDTILIIDRIRATNAIKLASENLKKMQVFYGVLLQYFAVSASKKPLKIELLNLLVKPLMEMSVEIPYFASICARQRLFHMRTQFCEIVKDPKKSAWPTSKTMILLRLWAMIFPCSDFRHAVMTPAILLMCEYLMRCPIITGRDVAVGSFLCSMLLSVTKQSLKFSPEPIVFIQNFLMAVVGRKSTQSRQFYHLVESKEVESLLHIQNFASDFIPLNFFAIMDMPEDSSFFSSNNFRAGLLMTIIENLLGYANIYDKISSFPEIFSPISSLLLEMASSQANLPDALRDKVRNVEQLIKTKIDEHLMIRQPLQMRKKKPVPIKLLNPKFETGFVRGRDYDPDHDRVVARKLKKLVKREAKGAARELRKDNHFLFVVKEKEKAALEEERVEKYGKARAFLQEQEHAFKSGQLGKGKGKGKKRRR